MAINDGGEAFPSAAWVAQENELTSPRYGMSLRDWFAGQAVMSLVMELHMPPVVDEPSWAENAARNAYALADALLAEREKGGA